MYNRKYRIQQIISKNFQDLVTKINRFCLNDLKLHSPTEFSKVLSWKIKYEFNQGFFSYWRIQLKAIQRYNVHIKVNQR